MPTRIDFLLVTAHAVSLTMPEQAQDLIVRAMVATVDPRLSILLKNAAAALEAGNRHSAQRWLNVAIEYREKRRSGRRPVGLIAAP